MLKEWWILKGMTENVDLKEVWKYSYAPAYSISHSVILRNSKQKTESITVRARESRSEIVLFLLANYMTLNI